MERMKKGFVFFLMLFPLLVFGQKIKVKKDVLTVDKEPYAKLEKVKDGATVYRLSSLNGTPLLAFDKYSVRAYDRGPILQLWKVVDLIMQDSVLIDFREYYNENRVAELIYERGLVEGETLNRAAFQELKTIFDQEAVEKFMAENELTLTKLVRRFPDAPVFIDGLMKDEIVPYKKYYIASGDAMNKITIGYFIIEDYQVSDRKYYNLNFYLPNGLIVGHIQYKDLKEKNYSKLYTERDKAYQDQGMAVLLNPADITKVIQHLVRNQYL